MTSKTTAQDPRTSSEQRVSLGGEQVVASRWRTFGDDFLTSAINETDAWDDDSSGGGAGAQASGVLTLSTSASTSAKGKVSGQDYLALLAQATTVMRVRARCPDDLIAGCHREIGLESEDAADRIYFIWDGVELYARIEKAGDPDSSEQKVLITHDAQVHHDFEIQATKGIVKMLFDDEVVANFTSKGAAAALVEQGRFKPFLNCENTTNDTDMELEVDSIEVYREPNPWDGQRIQPKALAADGAVFEGPGLLMYVQVVESSGGDCTWDVYDGTDVSTGRLIHTSGAVGEMTPGGVHWIGPIECTEGCYVNFTGSDTDGWFGFVR